MRVGVVILPDLDWPLAMDRWREAEERGFTTAWTYDHLSWRSLRDGPWFGMVPLLAAVATVTRSIRIGPLVTSPNFRHPVVLAKDAMTLDRISAGRLELGLGAGGTGYDAAVLGQPTLSLADRASRFEEFVDALDVLLREPMASFAGTYFTAVESRTVPGCVQQPRVPFTVAAAGRRALHVAARQADTWVTFGSLTPEPGPAQWYADLTRQMDSFRVACDAAGRPFSAVGRAALVGLDLAWAQESVDAWDDVCGKLDALGFTDVIVHWPRPDDTGLAGPRPRVFDEISRRLRSE